MRVFKSVWKLQLPLDPMEARLIAQRIQEAKSPGLPISYFKINHDLALALPGTRPFSNFTNTVYSGSTS